MNFRSQVEQLTRISRPSSQITPMPGPYLSIYCRRRHISISVNAAAFLNFMPKLIPLYCRIWPTPWLPVVNFTPNRVEIPAMLDEAVKQGVPLGRRDGKTGQTYFKVVLASALKAWNTCVRFSKRRDWRWRIDSGHRR